MNFVIRVEEKFNNCGKKLFELSGDEIWCIFSGVVKCEYICYMKFGVLVGGKGGELFKKRYNGLVGW